MNNFKRVKVRVEFDLAVADYISLDQLSKSLDGRMQSWAIQYAAENNASTTRPLTHLSTSNSWPLGAEEDES